MKQRKTGRIFQFQSIGTEAFRSNCIIKLVHMTFTKKYVVWNLHEWIDQNIKKIDSIFHFMETLQC